jgi:predicted DNA-binding transcriptional regulator AlpA
MSKSPEQLQIIYDSVYSVPQLAKLLQIRPETIYTMVRKKMIPYIQLSESTQIRFAGWQIRAWLDSKMSSYAKGGDLK